MGRLHTAILLACSIFSQVAVADGGVILGSEEIRGSQFPVAYHLIETDDGLFTPIGLRKPAGEGPFPIVLFASGNGGEGLDYVKDASHNRGWTLDQYLDSGYAVAWLRYRAEVDVPVYDGAPRIGRGWSGRPRYNRAPLEYEDVIATIEYVKNLSYVDPDRVGYLGMSHGGEMLMKIASEYQGLRVGIASEPASAVFLARKAETISPISPLETEPETSVEYAQTLETAVADLRARLDLSVALERIRTINIPILVHGRDRDHNQDVFRLNYELLRELGKNVEWQSYDHDEHGFVYVERDDDGEYRPDPVQREAVGDSIAFFDRHMK